MLDLLESLPFPVTTLVVAAFSVVIVALVSRVSPNWFRWVATLFVPFIVAYTTYWVPVWIRHRGDIEDYSAFEPMVVGIWGLAGNVGSLVCVLIVRKCRKDKSAHA